MTENKRSTPVDWVDPDDAPELDAHFFEHAEVAIGDRVIRPATDTMAKRGRGRPPKGSAAKVQQTLKLSPEVLEYFRGTGDGWQARIDDVLRQHVESQRAVVRDGIAVRPELLAEAAEFLRAEENGGWFVAPTGKGDWWLGTAYMTPAQILEFAAARGFDTGAQRSRVPMQLDEEISLETPNLAALCPECNMAALASTVAVVGVGGVGSTLIPQLHSSAAAMGTLKGALLLDEASAIVKRVLSASKVRQSFAGGGEAVPDAKAKPRRKDKAASATRRG